MEQKMVMVPQHIALMLQYCTYIFATILFPYFKQVFPGRNPGCMCESEGEYSDGETSQ